MPDAIFSHPRLARVYDALEGGRSDLDTYLGLAADAGAVLDVGCGTGTSGREGSLLSKPGTRPTGPGKGGRRHVPIRWSTPEPKDWSRTGSK